MIIMKRIRIRRLLTAVLTTVLFCSVTACDGAASPAFPEGTSGTPGTDAPSSATVRSVLKDYTIVRGDISGNEVISAMSTLRAALGPDTPAPATDWVNKNKGETVPAHNREILLGVTNRSSSVTANEALAASRPNNSRDFSISFYDREVVVAAGSDAVLSDAVQYLIDNLLDTDMSLYPEGYSVTVPYAYPADTFCGLDPDGLQIVCTDPALQSYAEQLQTYIDLSTGYYLPITDSGDGILLSLDPDMDIQSYAAEFTENGVSVRAGHTFSMRAAATRLLDGSVKDKSSFSGICESDIPLTMSSPKDGSIMHLIWNDEFDGDVLDPDKWTLTAKMSQGDITNGTDEHNVKVEDGKLLMRSWKEEDGRYSTNTSVTTCGTMSFRYGYLEMYANVPYLTGAWPSFWMQSKDTHRSAPYMTEIDIFEVFGERSNLSANLHKWYRDGINYHCSIPSAGTYTFKNSANLNNEYHLYGFGWTPSEMYFTVDGTVFFSYDLSADFGDIAGMEGFQDPLFIILNNFLFTEGSDWQPNLVSSRTEYPISYYVDWIRLYQKPGEGEIFYDAVKE